MWQSFFPPSTPLPPVVCEAPPCFLQTINLLPILESELSYNPPPSFTHVLRIEFSSPTNTPTAAALDYLTIEPVPPPSDLAEPVWHTDALLLIPVRETVVKAAYDSTLSVNLAKTPPPQVNYNATISYSFRLDSPGKYELSFATSRLEFTLSSCDAPSPLISPPALSTAIAPHTAQTTRPSFTIPSTLALPGYHPLSLPAELFPPTFTLSFSLYVPPTPADSYRTLFYKGDASSSTQRTPAAFFPPTTPANTATCTPTSDLLLQASSTTADDAAHTIPNAIPLGEWADITLTFVSEPEKGEDPSRHPTHYLLSSLFTQCVWHPLTPPLQRPTPST